MPYAEIAVNGTSGVIAMVESGIQHTMMSLDCAHRCDLFGRISNEMDGYPKVRVCHKILSFQGTIDDRIIGKVSDVRIRIGSLNYDGNMLFIRINQSADVLLVRHDGGDRGITM